MWSFTLATKSTGIDIMARIGFSVVVWCQPYGPLGGVENPVMCNEELVRSNVTGVTEKWLQSLDGVGDGGATEAKG